MSLKPDPNTPLREVTPEMRRRTTRTFIGVLVAFLAGIGVLLAAMSWQGRVVREYGQTVLKAAQAAPLTGDRPCADVVDDPLPSNVLTCTVETAEGQPTVVLSLRGDRQYRLK